MGLYVVEYFLLWINPVQVMSPDSDRYYLYHVFRQGPGWDEMYYDLACWITDRKKLFVLSLLTMWSTVLATTKNHWRRVLLSSAGRGIPLWVICALAMVITFALNPAALNFSGSTASTSVPALFGKEGNLFFYLYRLWWPSFMFFAVTQYLIGIDSLRVAYKRRIVRNVDRAQVDKLTVHVVSFPVIVFSLGIATNFAVMGSTAESRMGAYVYLLILLIGMHVVLMFATFLIFGRASRMELELGVTNALKMAGPGLIGALLCIVIPFAGMKVGDAFADNRDEETHNSGLLEPYVKCLSGFLQARSGRKMEDALELDRTLRKKAEQILTQSEQSDRDQRGHKGLLLGQVIRAYDKGSEVEIERCPALRKLWPPQ